MSWRVLAVVALLVVSVPVYADETKIGTISFGEETFEIVYAAARVVGGMNAVDLEFFDQQLPAGESYFSLDSEATASLRGMRLRISEDPAYKNGTWMHPSIEGHDKFYYFGEDDSVVLAYESREDRISGSIVGEDEVGGASIKVELTFDVPIVADD